MQIAIPFTEALALATAREPLPPFVRGVRSEGSVIHAEVDLRQIPDAPTALRLAAAAVGTVAVTARLAEFSGGVATIAVTAHARALPAHKLLGFMSGPLDAALRKQGLPAGLVEIRPGEPDPVLAVRVQDAVAAMAEGVTVTGLGLSGDVIYVAAEIGRVRLR